MYIYLLNDEPLIADGYRTNATRKHLRAKTTKKTPRLVLALVNKVFFFFV